MSRRERPPYAWTPGIPLERRIPCGTSPLTADDGSAAFLFHGTKCSASGSASYQNAGSRPQGVRRRYARCGPLAYWNTLASRHGAPFATSPVENAAHQVPHPLKAGSRPQGVQRRCVLEYVSLWRTQRTRFRNFLFAALLYKIEELGLSMHPDLHIDVPNVGLRRVERNAEFVGDKGDRTALGEKEQDVRLTL